MWPIRQAGGWAMSQARAENFLKVSGAAISSYIQVGVPPFVQKVPLPVSDGGRTVGWQRS